MTSTMQRHVVEDIDDILDACWFVRRYSALWEHLDSLKQQLSILRRVLTDHARFKLIKRRGSRYSRADDWPKVFSLRTLLVRSVQHLVTYTKMFVCISSFRIRLMASSLMSINRVTALEPYIPIITDY